MMYLKKFTKLFGIFKGGPYASLGIDIGASRIKAVKVIFNGASAVLSQAVSETVVDGNVQDALSRVVSFFSDVKKGVNLSIAGSNSVVMRYITMPRMEKKELFQALKFEATKYVPFPLEEVYFDAQIISPQGAADGNKMQVLLAAARKEVVNQRLETAQKAGISVRCVDIDCLAVFNAFSAVCPDIMQSYGKKTFALLNISDHNSNLDIIEGGSLRLSRDLHQGVLKMTERISAASSLSRPGVVSALADGLQEKQDDLGRVFGQAVSELAMELRVSFDYYESQSSSAVSAIQLSGAASGWPGFSGQLSELLGLPVDQWDPLRKPPAADDLALPLGNSGDFAVAAGLALRR